MRKLLLAAAIFSSALVAPCEAAERVALVIGNANYQQVTKLVNTKNDATEVGRALTKLGFSTRVVIDATEQTLRREIRRFAGESERAAMAVVFYAGHAVQVGGENYLVPIDMELPNREADVQLSALKLDDVLLGIKSTVRIVFLDACRDNPLLYRYLASRNIGARGLAPINVADDRPHGGTFVAYATEAGRTASDGNSEHSPFTEALLKHIAKPISLDDMFALVVKDVRTSTANAQRPYKYASLEEVVCLPPRCGGQGRDDYPSEGEGELKLALASNDLRELEKVAAKYPNSDVAVAAQRAVTDIKQRFTDEWVLLDLGKDPEGKDFRFYYQPSSVGHWKTRAWTAVRHVVADEDPHHNTTVVDCTSKKVGLAQWAKTPDSVYVNGDPRVVDLAYDIPERSLNELVYRVLCQQDGGRIVATNMLNASEWHPVATWTDGVSILYLLDGSTTVKGTQAWATVKLEMRATLPSTTPIQWKYQVSHVAAQCDTGKFAMLDGDFLDTDGHIVAKLLAPATLTWVIPAKSVEPAVKLACLGSTK